jgi:hypothetical protein
MKTLFRIQSKDSGHLSRASKIVCAGITISPIFHERVSGAWIERSIPHRAGYRQSVLYTLSIAPACHSDATALGPPANDHRRNCRTG